MPRLLIVEDEKDLQEILSYNFRQAGFEVSVAGKGAQGLALARQSRPDLVLLDLMLPDLSGLEICRTLKREAATASIPVVMLTARGEEIDRVVGLELGADDYVVKPFSVRELILRVQAVLRRAPASGEQAPSAGSAKKFGVLRIEVEAHRVFVEEREVELTALEFKLLETLFDRKNRVQSRNQLLDDVWGIEAAITTRTVDTHVKRLREKLGPAGEYIETVRGVGYRFAEAPPEAGR